MGILSDMFLARDEDLDALRPGEGGPAAVFPTVQAKNLDPLKLVTLESLAASRPATLEPWIADGQMVRDLGEEWVYRVPASLVVALAELPPGDVPRVASAWAATEEWGREDLVAAAAAALDVALPRLVAELCGLARRARREGTSLYLWLSL